MLHYLVIYCILDYFCIEALNEWCVHNNLRGELPPGGIFRLFFLFFLGKPWHSLGSPCLVLASLGITGLLVSFHFYLFFLLLWMDCLSKLNFIHDHIMRICLFYIHDNIMRIFKLKYLIKDSLLTIKNASSFLFFLFVCVCVIF